jgi:hypothetical protein
LRTQEARIQELEDRPQLGEPILDRRTRECDPKLRPQCTRGLRRTRCGVLDVLRLIQRHHRPIHIGQHRCVATQERIRRQHERARCQFRQRLRIARTLRAVVTYERQRRGEALQLALPISDDGRRTHQQRRSGVGTHSLQQQGNQLHRLAQAHVIGKTGAQTKLAHRRQPTGAALLVGAQGAHESFGYGEIIGIRRRAQTREHFRERTFDGDFDR